MESFWKSEHDIYTYLQRIRNHIETISPISEHDWEIFSKNLEYKRYRKHDLITRVGQIENYMYFLVKGAVMLSYLKNGTDYAVRFDLPGSFFNSYQSFIKRQPSMLKIEAVNNVIAFRLFYTDLDSFYTNSEEARLVGQRILENYHFQQEQREIAFLTKTAEEKYLDLIKTDPDHLYYIPLKYTASFLGVAPESLSRIRRKIITRP